MKFILSISGALVLGAVLAVETQKQVIFTYSSATPSDVMDKAKEAVRLAGGTVTHEFDLIKAFVASSTAKAIQDVRLLSSQFVPAIEDDGIINANAL